MSFARCAPTLVSLISLLLAAGCSSSMDSSADEAPVRGIGDGELAGTGATPGGDAIGAPAAAAPDSGAAGESDPSGRGATTAAAYTGDEAEGDSAADDDSAGVVVPEPETSPRGDGFQAGSLTAGAWDDNLNFDHFLEYRKNIYATQLPGLLPFSKGEHQEARELFAQASSRSKLDVALVIDTTGSMGDELSYLQTEFSAISSAIEDRFPNAEQRWSLVVYRDTSDEYVARWFDFTSDLDEFRADLASQSAGGGGDYEEASPEALTAVNELAWRTDSDVARLAFWVGDAPHHAGTEDMLADAIADSAEQGIHIYPVASSGIDDLTEVTMRSAAQLTGGRYLFLTDDSGYGNTHREPTIPCYFVTRLDRAIVRMVDIEMNGEYHAPEEAEIIRRSGDPELDGTCELQSGVQIQAF